MKKLFLFFALLFTLNSFGQWTQWGGKFYNNGVTKTTSTDTLEALKGVKFGDGSIALTATTVAFDTTSFLSGALHTWSGSALHTKPITINGGYGLYLIDATGADSCYILDNGTNTLLYTDNPLLITSSNIASFTANITPSRVANTNATLSIKGFGNVSGTLILNNTRNTYGTPYNTLATTVLGRLYFGGSSASSLGSTVTTYIQAISRETFSSTAQGADLQFWTCLKTTATAINRINILANGGIQYIPVNTGDVVAATGITEAMCSADMRYNGGSAKDISADPQIADGVDGQIIKIIGLSDSNTLTLDDGTGLQLAGGATFVIGLGDVISLTYISSIDLWVENYRADN